MTTLHTRRALAAVLLGLFGAACSHRLVRAPEPTAVRLPVREGYVQVDDSVRLFFRAVGEGSDTVVVVHGGPGFHFNSLAPDLTPLAARRTLLFFDQRGAGRSTLVSDTARLNARFLVRDLEALRNHFRLRRMTVLGHSWGGLLAGLYAAEHPGRVERLILLASMPPEASLMRQFTPMARLDSLENAIRAANLQAYRAAPADSTKACWDFYALWARGYFRRPVDTRRMWADLCNVPQKAMLHPARAYPVQSLGAWNLTRPLAGVNAPVLIVHGEHDPMPLASSRAWESALPNARLLLIPDAGHMPHVDRPAAFFTAMERFLDGEWPDSSVLSAAGAAVVLPEDRTRSPYLAARSVVAEVEDELVRAIGRADWDSVAAIYAEDAVIFAPGAPPVVGRQAIESFWRTAAKRGMRSVELQLMDLEGSGEQLNVVGKYVMRGRDGNTLDVGKFLATYKRVDGQWRLYRDVFNSSMETRSPLEVPDYLGPLPR